MRATTGIDPCLTYGDAKIETMSSDEPGYASLMLRSIRLTPEILTVAATSGVRIFESGGYEPLGTPGLILFGLSKADRPVLTLGENA